MTTKVEFDFPAIGNKNMYLMYHEELESLSTHFPEIERARFWMPSVTPISCTPKCWKMSA